MILKLFAEQFKLLALSGALTAALSLFVAPVARSIALVDSPNERKLHVGDVPVIGGLCIYLASSFTFIFFSDGLDFFTGSLLFFGGIVLLIGVVDDFLDVSAKIKFVVLLGISAAAIYSMELQVTSFGDLLGIGYLVDLGAMSLPFTVLAILAITNAFNMLDGCDGLSGGIALITIIGLLSFGQFPASASLSVFLVALAGCIAVFLIFNFASKQSLKIFLGDGGSLFLGFVIALSAVSHVSNEAAFIPSTFLWFFAVPIFDLVSVVVIRLVRGKNLMVADRSHVHHCLLSLGLSKGQTVTSILAAVSAFICFGIVVENTYPHFSFILFISVFFVCLCFRLFFPIFRRCVDG